MMVRLPVGASYTGIVVQAILVSLHTVHAHVVPHHQHGTATQSLALAGSAGIHGHGTAAVVVGHDKHVRALR